MGIMALKDLELSIFTKNSNKLFASFNLFIKGWDLLSVFEDFSKIQIDLIDVIIYLGFSIKREKILSLPCNIFLVTGIHFFNDLPNVLRLTVQEIGNGFDVVVDSFGYTKRKLFMETSHTWRFFLSSRHNLSRSKRKDDAA